MYIPEIIEVKNRLDNLKNRELISEWELPYENLLTRRSAAIFFLNTAEESNENLEKIWQELEEYENFSYRINKEMELSKMKFRITFSEEERKKNSQKANLDSNGKERVSL